MICLDGGDPHVLGEHELEKTTVCLFLYKIADISNDPETGVKF
jgi:hypothetical protein